MVCMFYLWKEQMSLRKYCKNMGYDYNTIREYVIRNGFKISTDEALNWYIEHKDKHDWKVKHRYRDMPLSVYCRLHGYCYGSILYLINKKHLSIEKAVKHHHIYRERKNAKTKKTKN